MSHFQVDEKVKSCEKILPMAVRLCLLHNRLHHRTGTDAAGAYTNLLGIAGNGCNPNLLQIGQPTPSRLVMGVTDIVSGNWLFAADFT